MPLLSARFWRWRPGQKSRGDPPRFFSASSHWVWAWATTSPSHCFAPPSWVSPQSGFDQIPGATSLGLFSVSRWDFRSTCYCRYGRWLRLPSIGVTQRPPPDSPGWSAAASIAISFSRCPVAQLPARLIVTLRAFVVSGNALGLPLAALGLADLWGRDRRLAVVSLYGVASFSAYGHRVQYD